MVAAISHLAGQLLVLLHQFLVLLVDGQHFADTVGSCLGLKEDHNIYVPYLLESVFSNQLLKKPKHKDVRPNVTVRTGTFQISPVQRQQRRDRSMTRRS